MKNFILAIFGITVIGAGVAAFYMSNNYQRFKPIYFEHGAYRDVKEPALFDSSLMVILTKYGEKYRVNDSGKVLVKPDLLLRKDIVFKYTREALEYASPSYQMLIHAEISRITWTVSG